MNTNSTRQQQSSWLNSLIHHRVKLILAIPVSCLVASLSAFSCLQLYTTTAENRLEQTQQVRLEAQQLLTALLDAETEVRGYALTRRREFINRYESAIAQIPISLENLRQLVHNERSQRQQLSLIRDLAQARVSFLQRHLQLIRSLPDTVTAQPEFIAQLLEGKQTRDRTLTEIDQFLAEEARQQTQRQQRLRQQRQLTWIVLSLSAGIGLAGSVLAVYLLNRLEGNLRERDRHLRESEARYRTVVENFPNGSVLLFNCELRYLIADGNSLASIGLSKAQLEGKTMWEVLPSETCSVLEPLYRDALAGRANTSEIPYANRIFLVHTQPLKNEAEEIVAGMVVTQDITEIKQAQKQLRQSEERYRLLVELCPDGIFLSRQGKFILVNRAAMRLYGATTAEALIGKSVLDFVHPDDREIVKERIRQLEEERIEVPLLEEKLLRLDGTVFYAEVVAIPFSYQNEPAVQVVIHDITERKRSEQQLSRVIRALRTLSECNQTVVRAKAESTLLPDICRIIVEFGGYRCVWIGFAEFDEAKTVRPVAQAGYDNGYIESLQITWSDTERGRGPTGMAIRTGQPSIAQNILTEPNYLPWREAALQQGYAASISLPLIVEENPLGALNIYATEPNAFDEDEVRLLTELAHDLAYGITALRNRVRRQQAEAALRESNQRLDGILNSLDDVVWSVSATTYEVLYLNPTTEIVYGRPIQEFFDNSNLWLEIVHPDDWKIAKRFYHNTLEMGSTQMEYRILRPDGEVRWLLDRASVTYDQDGTPIRIDGIATDITERKLAEEALRSSEERWQLALRGNNDGIWDWNVRTNEVFFSTRWKEMLGFADHDILNDLDEWAKRVHPDDLGWVTQTIQDHFDGKTPYYITEHRVQCKDGSYKWILDRGQAVWDENGKVVRMVGSHTDISDKKAAEAALQYQLEFEQRVANISTRFINLASAEIAQALDQALAEIGEFTQVDTCYIFLFSEDRTTARMIHEWVAPGIEPQIQNLQNLPLTAFIWGFAQIQQGDIVYIPDAQNLPQEATSDRANWQLFNLRSLVAIPLNYQGNVIGWVGVGSYTQEKTWSISSIYPLRIVGEIFTNALQRQQAETALRDSEERFRAMFEKSHAIKLIIDPSTGAILDTNSAALKFYGYSKSELLTKSIWDINTLSPEQVKAEMKKAQSEERNYFEFRHRLASGEVRDVEVYSSPIEVQGRILLISLIHDVTARKQTEIALQESEERFRAIFEQAAVGIALFTTSGEILRVNQQYCEITGYTESELLWRTFQEITHPDDLEQNLDYLHQLITGAMPTYTMEKRYIRKDGNWRWVHTSVSVVHDSVNNQNYALAVIKDIHDRKQAEESLREANQTLQALIQGSPLAIVALEPDARVKMWNEAAQRMFGWSASEVIGKVLPTVPAKKQDEFYRLIERVLQGESITELETLRQKRDGSLINISISKAPLYDGTGQIDGIMALITDISDKKAAEESLRDSEAKFRAFLEAASEAVIVTNANGEIVVFNAKAEELFGYDRTEVFGRTVEFLMPERYQQIHTHHRAGYRVHPSKRSMGKTNNLFAQRKDGTEFPIEAGLSPVQTKNGTFVLTFLTDITERKQAEDEIKRLNENLKRRAFEVETRYQQIVELAEEGIWVIDSEAKTTYVNHAMTRMLGYTEEEMVGRPLYDFMDQAMHQSATVNIDRRKQGIAEKHEFKLRRKDGKALWTYMSTSPVLDENGKLLWSCALVYDISERKQTEEQLRESSERISLANAELARATRLKDEFLASMSHELRTPLNAILGLTEALQEEVYGPLTDRQQRSLGTIEQSGRHLLELITDILDLSKIESGKMELEISSISPQSLCDSSLTFVKQQAHHKNIQLSLEIAQGLENIQVDERRMRQVLVNLLSNAVKFTPDGGEVWLKVEVNPEAEILQFSVIDTGIGIAPENLDKLFKPFVQLDSSLSRRYAGTGLGLALVRRIIELHGGSVSLESEVGKGSRLTVTLPWKKPDGTRQTLRETEPGVVELPTIHNALIVEDSETAAKQVARYLGELGSTAFIHTQGEGAVDAARRFDPEVIILDLLLPNISGWEVLAQLKANPVTRHIPVLIVSVVDERSRALDLGASEYLVKPISRRHLQLALSKIFAEVPPRPGHGALVVMPEEEQQLPLVLLAEDNEANITTIRDYLQLHEFRVSLARNGVEAVQMAHQQKPDLILMDIQMPEMDGLEATRRIHNDPNLSTIPIIALTALAMPGDRERCLAAGALEYLTKPVSLKKLLNVIAQYINN